MHRAAAALVVVSALTLAACGGGDPAPTAETSGAEPGGAFPGVNPDDGVASALGLTTACDLLGVADVEVAAGGMGWGITDESSTHCVYQAPDESATVRLVVTSLTEYEAAAAQDSMTAISAGASGMTGYASGDGYEVVLAPAGADGGIALSQSPTVIGGDAHIALVESAAIAFENFTPADGGAEPGDGAGGALTEGLLSVSVDGLVPSTGNSIAIAVTAERVAEEGVPALVNIACVGGSGDGTRGEYAVLAMDGGIPDGLRIAQIEATEAVDGAGTYGAAVELTEADGDSFRLAGTMTIDAGLDSGVFDVDDPSGAQVTGSWECVFSG